MNISRQWNATAGWAGAAAWLRVGGMLLATTLLLGVVGCGKEKVAGKPPDASSYWQAVALIGQDDDAGAVPLLRDAIALNSTVFDYHTDLVSCLTRLGRYDEALTAVTQAVPAQRTDMDRLLLLTLEADIYDAQHDFPKAKATLEHAVPLFDKEVDPFLEAYARNALAWLLATAPDPALHDGERAVALASRACEIMENGDPAYLDTLSAAHARAGDFAAATRVQGQALAMLEPQSDEATRLATRLALYEKGEPYTQAR